MKILLPTLFIILFFQGCSYTVYHPVAPTSYEGKQCVKICETKEYHCKEKEIEYTRRCEREQNRMKRAFDYCMEHNRRITEQIKSYCLNSPHKSQCMEDQNHVYKKLNQFKVCRVPEETNSCSSVGLNCEDRYERCFLNCGGSYYAQKRELF